MSCSPQAALAAAKRVPVRVNGVTIPHDAISREAQNHPAPTPIAAFLAAARALAVRELLLQEAKACRVQAGPIVDGAGQRETDEEALVRGLIEAQVKTPSPDEASCRRYYQQNRARFRFPDVYECSHVLIAARRDRPAAYAAARQRAQTVLEQILEAPTRFAALAAAHSDCPSRTAGGSLRQVTLGMTTPEFARALIGLNVGENSPLVEARYGFHIIRLGRRIAGAERPFEDVRAQIEAYLVEGSRRVAVVAYIALLAARAELVGVELSPPDGLRLL